MKRVSIEAGAALEAKGNRLCWREYLMVNLSQPGPEKNQLVVVIPVKSHPYVPSNNRNCKLR